MSRGTLGSALWVQNKGQLLFIMLMVLFTVGFFVTRVQIIDPELVQLRERQADLQQQVRQQKLLVTQSGLPVSTTEKIADDLRKFRELIPDKQKFSSFIGILYKWANRAGLQIDSVSYQPKLDSELNLLQYGLSFSVHGDYTQLKKFIHSLENSQRILIIEKIALASKKSQESNSP